MMTAREIKEFFNKRKQKELENIDYITLNRFLDKCIEEYKSKYQGKSLEYVIKIDCPDYIRYRYAEIVVSKLENAGFDTYQSNDAWYVVFDIHKHNIFSRWETKDYVEVGSDYTINQWHYIQIFVPKTSE